MKKIALIFITICLSINIFSSVQPKLIAEHAELEVVSDKFVFTEGPASDTVGNVYFSDIRTNIIYKYGIDGSMEVFMDNIPCNGLAFDNNEMMIVCGNVAGRTVSSLDISSKDTTVLAWQFEGKKLNSPNDLWIDKKNGIYFSDPRYEDMKTVEQPSEQVYYLSPDRKSLTKVTNDMKRPNGVYGINNGKNLLIADHSSGKIYIYNIKKDGTLTGKEVFIENEHVDGMTVDNLGNIYVASQDIKVYNNKGVLIEVIKTPRSPTNVCFGGKDRKYLFITENNFLYKLKMNISGARY